MEFKTKSLENILQQFGESMNKEDRRNLKELLREMKLDNFQFKHIASNTVYTAKRKFEVYEITWIEEGKEEKTTYGIESVKEYIRDGYWIIQEVK